MFDFVRPSLTALGGIFVTKVAHDAYYADWRKIYKKLNEDMFSLLRKMPVIGTQVNKQIEKDLIPMLDELGLAIAKRHDPSSVFTHINHEPSSTSDLIAQLAKLKQDSSAVKLYKVSGAVYTNQNNQDLNQFRNKIAELSSYTNPLHPDVWPQLSVLTAQVIQSCLLMFHATNPEEGFGHITPGGTYSIIEAVKAYRNRFEAQQTLIGSAARYLYQAKPEIIVPNTVHAGFEKAADLLGCKLIKVAVTSEGEVNLKAVEQSITKNTILLVGSAPSYPTGTMDNIEALGALAVKHKIGLHVDACLGGFVVPFLEDTKFASPYQFGFDVPGVSSISVDTHKEGGADKGSSVILYKSKNDLGKYQMSTHMDWPGGLYATSGMGGSASGYCVASAWAMMHHIAREGYTHDATHIASIIKGMKESLGDIEGISIMGRPDANVIAFQSCNPKLNIHVVVDHMHERGWHLNTLPNGFHFCVTGVHINHDGFLNEFLDALKAGAQFALDNPTLKPKSDGAIYGATKSLPKVFTPLKEYMAQEYLAMQTQVPKPVIDNSKSSERSTKKLT